MWLTSFTAVLKKNFILKRRSYRLSLLEIFFPLYFLLIIIIITKTGSQLRTKVPEQIFGEIPSYTICNGCSIGWAPSNMSFAQDVMNDFIQYNNLTNVTILSFETEADFEAAYVAHAPAVHAGVIFSGGTEFALRFNDSLLQPSANASHYVSGGYVALQRAVHESLINVVAGGGTASRVQLNYTTKAFPIAPYTVPSVTYYMWAFYFPIIYGYSLVHVITGVVTEKEKKLKDAMRTMGCPPSAYWLSWLLIQLLMITLATSIFLAAVYISGTFHVHSLPVGPIFLTFLLYALCLTTLGFLVSVFADTPRSGVIGAWLFVFLQLGLGGVGHFLLYKRAPWVQTLFSFFPVVPLMESVLMWADAQTFGMTFSLSQPGAGRHVIALLYDCIIYGVLAAYFEKAMNDTGGYLFFLSREFWAPKSVPGDADDASPLLAADRQRAGIELQSLTREFVRGVFKRDTQVAVDHLSFSVQRGEIFALLGHNGAGKSTTISMLTGALPPTSGDARLLGCSVVRDTETVRSFVGVCPQTDIVFDLLTAVEHVQLFAGLKGQPVTHAEAVSLLQEASLDPKHADEMASGFSGGMKRKLTTALAFVGGSQVVFLDECTAGMDPYSRKKIWAMLQKYKRNRTIVLTTHYMEEADLLGDTIAIMSKGHIQAMGSSLELKTKFGLGYRLTFVKHEGARDAPIASFLHKFFEDCSVLNSNEAEVTYQLPRTALAAFPKLFAELDRVLPALQVRSYGLSMTTLEEVFLRLAKEESEAEHAQGTK